MYILLSKRIAIEGVMGTGGGVLAIFCFSVIHAKLCHFRQYLFMHQREDRIAYFETNGYLNRDISEARNLFIKKIALVSPPILKYLENRLFSVSFFSGSAYLFSNSAPPPRSESYDRPLKFKLINIVIKSSFVNVNCV